MDLSSAINVIESVAGFTDTETAVGEAWAVVMAQLEAGPAPVAVSDRLPQPEDCDAEGRCWVGYPELTYSIADTGDADTTTPEWRLEHQPLKPKGSRCCWLPATALPLPQGEVQP